MKLMILGSFFRYLILYCEDIIKNYKTLDNNVREFLLTIKQSDLTAKTINELQLNDRLGIHRVLH